MPETELRDVVINFNMLQANPQPMGYVEKNIMNIAVLRFYRKRRKGQRICLSWKLLV